MSQGMSIKQAFCVKCDAPYSPFRAALGYDTCLKCGEQEARQRKFAVVPMHKSNYIPVFSKELLTGINSKQTRNG